MGSLRQSEECVNQTTQFPVFLLSSVALNWLSLFLPAHNSWVWASMSQQNPTVLLQLNILSTYFAHKNEIPKKHWLAWSIWILIFFPESIITCRVSLSSQVCRIPTSFCSSPAEVHVLPKYYFICHPERVIPQLSCSSAYTSLHSFSSLLIMDPTMCKSIASHLNDRPTWLSVWLKKLHMMYRLLSVLQVLKPFIFLHLVS